MAKKKHKKTPVPKALLITCIISGVATLVLRMLNQKLRIPELGEINSYAGTTFVITIVIIGGILLVNQVNAQ